MEDMEEVRRAIILLEVMACKLQIKELMIPGDYGKEWKAKMLRIRDNIERIRRDARLGGVTKVERKKD